MNLNYRLNNKHAIVDVLLHYMYASATYQLTFHFHCSERILRCYVINLIAQLIFVFLTQLYF